MIFVGCDFHSRFQRIAMLDTETGELIERSLSHENGEVKQFYASVCTPARIGLEATSNTRWFERLAAELGHELWIGDAARIRAMVVRKQKTDPRDAAHLLDLLLTDRFPRIWVPSPHDRDTRQLIVHRQKLVRMRASIKNQLQSLTMSQGLCRRRKLWNTQGRKELEVLPLEPWAHLRREELLRMLDQMESSIGELDRAVVEEARTREDALRLMTHPGVGANIALAFVLTIGPAERFERSKQVVSYLGLNPTEYSTGGRQHFGPISKQGNMMMRWLLVEGAHTAVRYDAELRRDYLRLKVRRSSAIAITAIARKLAIRMYWMLRSHSDYPELVRMQGSPRGTVVTD
jgi:transposase